MTYKKIELSELFPADVIVTTDRHSPISATIRSLTGSSISHTMLYAGSNFVIEAWQAGVQKRHWDIATKTATLAIAPRKLGITGNQRKKVVEAAQQFVNKKKYDAVGAIGSGWTFRMGFVVPYVSIPSYPFVTQSAISRNASDEHADDAFFCSELVSRVFSLAGVPIVNGRATDQTPRQIRFSPYLQYLGHLIDKKEPVDNEAYPSFSKAKIG